MVDKRAQGCDYVGKQKLSHLAAAWHSRITQREEPRYGFPNRGKWL